MTEDVLQRIRMIRFSKDLSQQFVAEKLEVSQSFYAKIESGKTTLTVEMLLKLAIIFKVQAKEFFEKKARI